jgi:hypothetical protein
MPSGLGFALLGALCPAALSTLFDFVWARHLPEHRAAFGLIHGALLFLFLGGFLGVVRGRVGRGAMGGAGVGLAAAAGFYALAPLLGGAAIFASWTVAFLPGFLALLLFSRRSV